MSVRDLTLLGCLLTLLAVLGSCKRGPKVEWCLVSTDGLACSYLKEQRKITFDKADGYKCAKPDDVFAFLKDCEVKEQVKADNYCKLDAKSKMLGCIDGSFVPLEKAINYGCMDSLDLDALVTWCNKRK